MFYLKKLFDTEGVFLEMGWHVPRQGEYDLQSRCGEFDTHSVHIKINS